MSSATANGWTYPVDGDAVSSQAATVQSLADTLETRLRRGRVASGNTAVTTVTLNVVAQQAITFPAGLFTAAPTVIARAETSAPHNVFGGAVNITTSGCNLQAVKTAGALGVVTVHWVAIQQ